MTAVGSYNGAIPGGATISRGATRRVFVVNDFGEKTFRIVTAQDCSAIVERNKRLQAAGNGYTPSRDLRWAASVPNIFIEQWMKETGVNCYSKEFGDILRRKLNDPDFRHFRTALWQF